MRVDAAFPVMGSSAHVTIVEGDLTLCDVARARLEDLEQRWSRFIGTSEVSFLNRANGEPCWVSDETRLLVRRAVEGHRVTEGGFDPTLLGAMLRAGYVESFDRAAGWSAPRPEAPELHAAAAEIDVDDLARTITLPVGVGFDPGGIGKGLAADLVAEELMARGAAGACVNVGGDLRVIGAAPDGDSWRIAVDDPRGDDQPIARLQLREGAVATSSQLRRRWSSADGVEHHHLVDPATGTSARTPVLTTTVVASEGWRAEVLAKAAFLDAHDGLALIERLGAAALVVVPDGIVTTSTWTSLAVDVPHHCEPVGVGA